MSPLPSEFIDRWQDRPDNGPGEETLYWHILLGDEPQVRSTAKLAQELLGRFSGLHMTPLRWLHITVRIAGNAAQVDETQMTDMLQRAKAKLSHVKPVRVTLGRVLYHPEAVMLGVRPSDALDVIAEAAVNASGTKAQPSPADRWVPHITLCYSTDRQPAAPVMSTLGRDVPATEVNVDNLSLVIQRGSERLWDWHVVGTVRLPTCHYDSV